MRKPQDLDTLRRTEWSPAFEKFMRNRLLMGYFRYGALHDRIRKDHDIPAAIRKNLKAYEADGNLEHLVDIGALALVEFVRTKHPLRHFKAIEREEP